MIEDNTQHSPPLHLTMEKSKTEDRGDIVERDQLEGISRAEQPKNKTIEWDLGLESSTAETIAKRRMRKEREGIGQFNLGQSLKFLHCII